MELLEIFGDLLQIVYSHVSRKNAVNDYIIIRFFSYEIDLLETLL